MKSPVSLLRFIAKALLNASGLGVAGDLITDVLPDVATDVWEWWNNETDEIHRQAELQTLAMMQSAVMQEQVIAIVEELAANKSSALRRALSDFLEQIPAMVRETLGTTISTQLLPRSGNDILALLPRWTLICHGGYQQRAATIRARRRLSLEGPSLSRFSAIAASLEGSFEHGHHQTTKIRSWMAEGILFVEVRIVANLYPHNWVPLDFAKGNAREILADFETAIAESESCSG